MWIQIYCGYMSTAVDVKFRSTVVICQPQWMWIQIYCGYMSTAVDANSDLLWLYVNRSGCEFRSTVVYMSTAVDVNSDLLWLYVNRIGCEFRSTVVICQPQWTCSTCRPQLNVVPIRFQSDSGDDQCTKSRSDSDPLWFIFSNVNRSEFQFTWLHVLNHNKEALMKAVI